MYCLFPAAILAFMLSACAVPSHSFFAASVPPPGGAHFRFDWQLSGSRAVAPLQVFDDGKRTWLQFNQGVAVPAIFARTAAGDTPLRYRREGDYLVLPGVWPELVLRGGHLQSRVKRKDHGEASALTTVAAATEAAIEHGRILAVDNRADIAPDGDAAGRIAVASAPVPVEPSIHVYAAELSDGNLRLALARWARRAGWTFAPEHWAVDVDIPLTAAASFETDFKASVQALIGSTELTDHPLQPCFYSNQVLRIVPYAQPCERNAGLGRAS